MIVTWPIRIHYPDSRENDFVARDSRILVGTLEYWPSEEWETEDVELWDAEGHKLIGKINIALGICDLSVE